MPLDILTANFFEIFNLPVSFSFESETVQIRYRELQKMVHPDKFVNSSPQEKRLSMQQSTQINEAFNTLNNPVTRALYLLKLKGLDINFENETTMDAAFLMEQLELREKLADINKQKNPLDKLDTYSVEVKHKLSVLMEKFSENYELNNLAEARENIRQMQFLQKAQNEINQCAATIEDELLG